MMTGRDPIGKISGVQQEVLVCGMAAAALTKVTESPPLSQSKCALLTLLFHMLWKSYI